MDKYKCPFLTFWKNFGKKKQIFATPCEVNFLEVKYGNIVIYTTSCSAEYVRSLCGVYTIYCCILTT